MKRAELWAGTAGRPMCGLALPGPFWAVLGHSREEDSGQGCHILGAPLTAATLRTRSFAELAGARWGICVSVVNRDWLMVLWWGWVMQDGKEMVSAIKAGGEGDRSGKRDARRRASTGFQIAVPGVKFAERDLGPLGLSRVLCGLEGCRRTAILDRTNHSNR